MTHKLVAMARVSGFTQENNTSLDFQYQRIQAWCQANDAEIIYSVIPAVESATAELCNRPTLQHALRAMELTQADGLIVYDVDRFFRNVSEALTVYKRYFEGKGRRLVACQQSFDASTLEGWFIFVQFLLFAEYAGRKQNARMQAGKQCNKQRRGFNGGRVPYGYKLGEGKQLIASEREQRVIRKALEFNALGLGPGACASKLNALGFRKRNGQLWCETQVARIINSNKQPSGATAV